MRSPASQVSTVSTLSAGAQVMGIDAEGMGTVLSILSNLYSDPHKAVVREYATNALDSHVEAGNNDPILVTSPSHLNPTLTIQDFGVGLSRDEMLNVYARYGTSTKRNTNDQIGSFGIGAKSAFAIGTQFVVTAVKDGEKTVALFALDDNGAPTVNILASDPTDEPNGVRVEIGVRDVNGVNSAIEKLFATWKPGTVEVDGIQPPTIWAEASRLADDIHIAWRQDRYKEPGWIVVMGGTSYLIPPSVPDSLSLRLRQIVMNIISSHAKVILTVPIGSVDITPSREELMVTPKTTATIGALVEKFNVTVPVWIDDQVADSGSLIEAIIRRHKLVAKIGASIHHSMKGTWKGQPLNLDGVDFDAPVEHMGLGYRRNAQTAQRKKGMTVYPYDSIERFLFVLNVPERRVRSVQLAAKPYLSQEELHNGITVVIAVPDTKLTKDWFTTDDPAVKTADFDEFVAKWKPPVTRSARGGATQYKIKGDATPYTATELNELKETVLYLTADEHNRVGSSSPVLANLSEDNLIVILKPTQKFEVLAKRVKLAEPAMPHIEKLAKDIIASITQDDADAVAAATVLNGIDRDMIRVLTDNEAKVTNPEAIALLATHRRATVLSGSNDHARMSLLRSAARHLGIPLDTGTPTITLDGYNKITEGLPLLVTYLDRAYRRSSLGDQHVIDYVNSINLAGGKS
jgi:hypothetical protein